MQWTECFEQPRARPAPDRPRTPLACLSSWTAPCPAGDRRSQCGFGDHGVLNPADAAQRRCGGVREVERLRVLLPACRVRSCLFSLCLRLAADTPGKPSQPRQHSCHHKLIGGPAGTSMLCRVAVVACDDETNLATTVALGHHRQCQVEDSIRRPEPTRAPVFGIAASGEFNSPIAVGADLTGVTTPIRFWQVVLIWFCDGFCLLLASAF